MNSKIFTPRFLFVTSAIVLAAASRLLPHIPNFTPVAAMALFGGVYFTDKKLAFIIPFLAMCLSDGALEMINGTGSHNTVVYVYAGFALTSLIGLVVRKNISFLSIAGGSIVSSILFFLITNFGVWEEFGSQPNAIGLSATYIMGIPFFAPTLLGDLFYNGVLFGAFYLAQRRLPSLVRA